MSKVMIKQIGERNHNGKPLVMTWEQYLDFCKKVAGEGETWKAVLI